jgi:predicted RNase H-like nuclease (RuvC/YqgF family)
VATKLFNELKREQKDVGKLKQNDEKLKMEMASLKAMLAAQAQSASASGESEQAMLKKKQQIELLESRIKKLEGQLEREKEIVKELEAKLAKQKEAFRRRRSICNSHTVKKCSLLRQQRLINEQVHRRHQPVHVVAITSH